MSEQQVESELSISEVLKLYLAHWRLFCVLTLGLFTICLGVYIFKIPFIASSKIVINDTQNSTLQAFSNQFFGMSKSVQETKKGSSQISKHIEYLKTREFYETLLQRLQTRGESPLITMEERQGFDELKKDYLQKVVDGGAERQISLLQKLDSWTKLQLESDFALKVSAITPDRKMSLYISNTATEVAAEVLRKREMAEMGRVEKFMLEQKQEADQNVLALSQQLAQLQ
ncbi:MAG: hypothetical protein AAGB31_08605, partial [Bdellovibrio sp.]